ncbi:MAG: phospholipid carrier-dependent glycosyltransferase [Bryobacteraceae bacterium]|jgi:hypothetical protein
MEPSHTARWTAWLAAALIAVFLVIVFAESRLMSPTSDEPPHLAAGLSYFVTHQIYRANPQHPPLLKELSALSLMLAGIRWPHTQQADYLVHGDPARVFQLEWPVGNALIAADGPDRVMFWARLPLILIAASLAALLYLWGRQILGPLAAVGAVFIYVLDPTILAHSYLVTTDVGLAAFTILSMFALWNYMSDPSWKRLVFCGLALGGALTAKFSALFLLPVVGVLLLAGLRWRPNPDSGHGPAFLKPRTSFAPPLDGQAGASSARSSKRSATAVEPRRKDLCPCGSGKKYKNCHGAPQASHAASLLGRNVLLVCGVFAAVCLVAFLVIETTYFFPSDLMLYAKCARMVNADHRPDYLTYLAGQLSPHFMSYFGIAYFLKEPIASIVLAGIGLIALVRSRTIPVIGKLFLLLPPAVLFLAVSVMADDIGFRYIMPVLPFVYLLGGLGLATLINAARRLRWAPYAAAVLCGWMVLAAAGVYPDHLPYFNEAACLLEQPGQIGLDGGTRCGPAWLDDSNVEWGESLKELKVWLSRHANGRIPMLAIFTSFPPEAYGIHYQHLEGYELAVEPSPGLYVVSAHFVARIPLFPRASDWLRRVRPVAIVGHSLYVYDIPKTP